MPVFNPHSLEPIGVFDSGVGGLSVLRQLLRLLPQEDFVYLADTAWAPYGERSEDDIRRRCLDITQYLVRAHAIKALVIACNTATAAAASLLRERFPTLPLIGIEPAIKPAASLTRTGHIGVMATRATVGSARFQQLARTWGTNCHLHILACNGLALSIENALENHPNPDGETVRSLCERYMHELSPFVGQDSTHGIDTLVLGCTHYPFATRLLAARGGPGGALIEPGEPVAGQTARLLGKTGLLRSAPVPSPDDASEHPERPVPGTLILESTAFPERLTTAARRWLHLPHIEAHAVTLS